MVDTPGDNSTATGEVEPLNESHTSQTTNAKFQENQLDSIDLGDVHGEVVADPLKDDDTIDLDAQGDVTSSEKETEIPQVLTDENGKAIIPIDLECLIGVNLDHEKIVKLLDDREVELGLAEMDSRAQIKGSWENVLYSAAARMRTEQLRMQEALSNLSEEERANLVTRFRDEHGKVVLGVSPLSKKIKPGETITLTAEDAQVAFDCRRFGGGFRIQLFNSGISVDIIAPTGIEVDTMMANCHFIERQMGAQMGAHYFTYADVLIKEQMMRFVLDHVTNSSFSEWSKDGKLASVIKLPDLDAIVTYMAAMTHPDGFDNFKVPCTRVKTQEDPRTCTHVETLKINVFDLAVTRKAALSTKSLEFMAETRTSKKHTFAQVTEYQKNLGIDGEIVTVGDIRFCMRVPSIMEHLETGAQFLADIENEIEGDNTQGKYNQVAFRYMRSFAPWVQYVEAVGPGDGAIRSSDRIRIIRELDKLRDGVKSEDDAASYTKKFASFVDRAQLTYVGYPSLPCPACGYAADTPSGMITIDPFSTFFTLASLFSR